MEPREPEDLDSEQQAVEGAIRAAFKGVSREGGISWSEAEVIDGYGSMSERVAARTRDTERTWEELVDDPDWNGDRSYGGFAFLDPIGFRYYIAPAMIQGARQRWGEYVAYALARPSDCAELTEEQSRAVARFLRFMVRARKADDDETYAEVWQQAYDAHWHQYDKRD
jgi:hypothetical protein